MVSWWEFSGQIEHLGSHQLHLNGVNYTLFRVRGADGKIISLEKVMVGNVIDSILSRGGDVHLVGFTVNKVTVIYAVVDGAEQINESIWANAAFSAIKRLGIFRNLAVGTALLGLFAGGLGYLFAGLMPIAALVGHFMGGRYAAAVPSVADMDKHFVEILERREQERLGKT